MPIAGRVEGRSLIKIFGEYPSRIIEKMVKLGLPPPARHVLVRKGERLPMNKQIGTPREE